MTAEDGGLREPFPWMSKDKPTGRYRMTVRHPLTEAILGFFLLAAGLLFFAMTLQTVPGLGAFLLVIFGGLGVLLLVMAAARAKWLKAYRRLHGYSPFTML